MDPNNVSLDKERKHVGWGFVLKAEVLDLSLSFVLLLESRVGKHFQEASASHIENLGGTGPHNTTISINLLTKTDSINVGLFGGDIEEVS